MLPSTTPHLEQDEDQSPMCGTHLSSWPELAHPPTLHTQLQSYQTTGATPMTQTSSLSVYSPPERPDPTISL